MRWGRECVVNDMEVNYVERQTGCEEIINGVLVMGERSEKYERAGGWKN